jgi:hypothetical protein
VAAEARAMMYSRVGLAVLAAVAVVLAALVALEPRPSIEDHALVPDLDVGKLRSLTISGVTLERLDPEAHATTGVHWRWTAPPGDVDMATLDAAFAALRGGRWHRRASRATAGTPRSTVVAGDVTLGIGAALAGTGQTWIARADDAVLVDDWVASALSPPPLALRVRHPYSEPPELLASYLVDPDFVRRRAEAYAAVEVVALPPCVAPLVLVQSPSGDGCVDAHLLAAAQELEKQAPPIDPRPVPFAAQHVKLFDGAELDRTKRPQISDGASPRDADPERVAELVAALSEPCDVVLRPSAKPTGTMIATTARDSVDLKLYANEHLVARGVEDRALRPSAHAWDVLTRPAVAYRDSTRWLEDSATISAITIDGKTYRRGTTLGAWTEARDPAVLELLAAALAALRADTGPAPAKVEHTIELAITPPVGAPSTHKLELGASCAARADGEPVVLTMPVCTAVTAALARQ